MIKKFLKIFTKNNIHPPNRLQNLKNDPKIKKIFNSINDHSAESEILFVGGCVRQNILGEKIEDIDLATNLNPDEVVNCCLLYTSPSPRDKCRSRMPSSA